MPISISPAPAGARPTRWMLLGSLWLAAAASAQTLPASGGPANSASCEPIRSRIEANIRSKGIADAMVTVHESAARPGGQRVGDCEGGRKLLWYTRGGPAAPSPVAASPALAAQRRNQPILTECADGSVVYGGDCGKRR